MLWGQKTQNSHNSEDLMGWERAPEAVGACGGEGCLTRTLGSKGCDGRAVEGTRSVFPPTVTRVTVVAVVLHQDQVWRL